MNCEAAKAAPVPPLLVALNGNDMQDSGILACLWHTGWWWLPHTILILLVYFVCPYSLWFPLKMFFFYLSVFRYCGSMLPICTYGESLLVLPLGYLCTYDESSFDKAGLSLYGMHQVGLALAQYNAACIKLLTTLQHAPSWLKHSAALITRISNILQRALC